MEPVFKFQVMFEQSLGLREPWHVTKALFNEQERAVHVYISGRKTAEYPCPECGKPLVEKVKFCPECGAKIQQVVFCKECGAKLEAGTKFCSECGTKTEAG